MSYLGKTPTQGFRQRFVFTATGGETSISGADDSSNTLTYTDGEYIDVLLNGVQLIAGSDYNTTTANTIGGLTALTASDVVEVMVYDVFSVANLSSYFTTARVPFIRSDGTVKNIPLNADQKVPFTRFNATSSDFSLTN
jgi:hypothetical protein